MALFRDWRSPGEKWIRTDFGWRRLGEIRNSLNQQLRRQFSFSSGSSSKASSAGSSKKVSRATSPFQLNENEPLKPNIENSKSSCIRKESEKINNQVKQLNELLDQRCVSPRSTSKESSHYSTVADAVNKLNFDQALNNDGCFPFICQVVALVFETNQGKLSGSMQNSLLRLTDKAKDISSSTRKHSGVVLRMMESAIPFFETLRREQFTSFGVRNVDAKIKSVLKMKRQLESGLHETQFQNKPHSLELTDLPVDCLQHIAKYLAHPRDLLNLGMTSMMMYQITEDNCVWRGLTVYHYGQVKPNTASWRDAFIMQYREHEGKLKCELSAAVCLCKTCNFVFWKAYGHPCLSASGDNAHTSRSSFLHQHLTPEQFLQFFVF